MNNKKTQLVLTGFICKQFAANGSGNKNLFTRQPAESSGHCTNVSFTLLLIACMTGLLFSGCKRDLTPVESDTIARSVRDAAKPITESSFFEKNKDLGGDVTILKSEDKAENNITSKVFHISQYMFWQIARDKYGVIMENLKENWKANKYTKDRKYIAPIPETFTKKYVKKILSRL